jgi:hypothetical protein
MSNVGRGYSLYSTRKVIDGNDARQAQSIGKEMRRESDELAPHTSVV